MKSEMMTNVVGRRLERDGILLLQKRIERRINMLKMLGIERTSVDTIARSSVDFVISLVILSSLINLATVEN